MNNYDHFFNESAILSISSNNNCAGLLTFRAVAEPRNSVKILSNTCLFNILETYFSYWGYLLAVNMQIYLETSSLKRATNVLKLPGTIMLQKTGH